IIELNRGIFYYDFNLMPARSIYHERNCILLQTVAGDTNGFCRTYLSVYCYLYLSIHRFFTVGFAYAQNEGILLPGIYHRIGEEGCIYVNIGIASLSIGN